MKANELAEYLKIRSREICADNRCTDEEHNCESYAYIDENGDLLDICAPDYFQGSRPHAAIPLPWDGTPADLNDEIEAQCVEMEM